MSTSNLKTLLDVIANAPLPRDDKDHHSPLTPKSLHRDSSSYQRFQELVAHYVNESKGKRKRVDHLAVFSLHWEYFLLCLSWSMFQRNWLYFSLDDKAYKTDQWLLKYKLSHSCVKDIVSYLQGNELVEFRKGALYQGETMRSRIFPKEHLAAELWQFFLDSEEDIKPPYVTLNDPNGKWGAIINTSLPNDHPDKLEMTKINEFLKGHKWACKAPVRLVYNTDAFHGGRLITPYQSLPDRSYRLRINTLIDGNPIVEVDFNANHLRLALAVLNNEYAGDTPYEDIGEIAKVDDRATIKMFITIAMGAKNTEEAMKACASKGIPNSIFNSLSRAALQRFPGLPLFESWGVLAQNLEGAILKDVMLQGVEKGIVCLPVHDAIAVPQGNEDWALEVMHEAWQKVTGGMNT